MFCFSFLLSTAGNIIHLFALSTPIGLGCPRSSPSDYLSFFLTAQEAKISNIFKNKSWHVPLCQRISEFFYGTIKLGLSMVQTLSSSQGQVLQIAFRGSAIHPFSKTLSPQVCKCPGTRSGAEQWHVSYGKQVLALYQHIILFANRISAF